MPQVWKEDSLPIGVVEIGVFVGFVSLFVKVVTTVLSLLVVVAAVAAVAWLVFRTPSEAVDSAERLDPVGTARPAWLPDHRPDLAFMVLDAPTAAAGPQVGQARATK